MANETKKGNPVHHPIMTRPGSTKIMEDRVPAADASVWTILFSWMVEFAKRRSSVIETTVAGMDVANVSPALRPKYTLAAVSTRVITIPSAMPRTVNSLRNPKLIWLNLSTLPYLGCNAVKQRQRPSTGHWVS